MGKKTTPTFWRSGIYSSLDVLEKEGLWGYSQLYYEVYKERKTLRKIEESCHDSPPNSHKSESYLICAHISTARDNTAMSVLELL